MSATTSQLDLFRQLVEAGSISACARVAGVAPDAIADGIAALEERLGHPLVEIDGGKVRLTPAGERAWEALNILGGRTIDPTPVPARPSATPARPAPERSIRLACSQGIFATLADGLARFEDAHPHIAIEVDRDSVTQPAIARAFATGRIDVACFHAVDAPTMLESDYLWSEPISLFVSADHPLAARDYVSAQDLVMVSPILPTTGNPNRPLIDAALARAGFGAAPPAIETDDPDDQFAALIDPTAGDDAAFLPLFGAAARAFAGSDAVVRLRFGSYLAAIDVRCAVRPGIASDPLVAALRQSLQG